MTNTTQELKACPCGKIPTDLGISDIGQGSKWAGAYGNCCSEWIVEFRTQYSSLDSEACKILATLEWNAAPRQNTRADRTQAIDDCINVVENERTDDDRSVVCNQIIEKLEAIKNA